MKKKGSRIEVMNGIAEMTGGGLKKKDLMYKDGKIISKKMNKIKIYKQRGGKKNCKELAYDVYNALNKTSLNSKDSRNDNTVLNYITKKRTLEDSSNLPIGDNRSDFIIRLDKYLNNTVSIDDDILIHVIKVFLDNQVDLTHWKLSVLPNLKFKLQVSPVISEFFMDYREDIFNKIYIKISEQINNKKILKDGWEAIPYSKLANRYYNPAEMSNVIFYTNKTLFKDGNIEYLRIDPPTRNISHEKVYLQGSFR